MTGEIKVVITGTVGAGKTTAIQAICGGESIVTTEMKATDGVGRKKDTTTVAMDYGEISLPEGEKLRIYGTPGQERFRYMWEILARGALGFIILVDRNRRDPVADLDIYLENFDEHIRQSAGVVGVTKEVADNDRIDQALRDHLNKRGFCLPLFSVDPRQGDQVALLLETLISQLEFSEVT